MSADRVILEPMTGAEVMALVARVERLRSACEKFVALVESFCGDDPEAQTFISPGCIVCTSGTVPDIHNTGLCAYHAAKEALR